MITVTISGPQGAGKTSLRRQIQSLLTTSGKVVRVYEDGRLPEKEMPTYVEYIIIVKQE